MNKNTHSRDFACVNWNGVLYSLSERQSKVVRILFYAFLAGKLSVSGEHLTKIAGKGPLSAIFQRSKAWKNLVVESGNTGFYQLQNSDLEICSRQYTQIADKPPRPKPDGWVYFIQSINGGAIKIGYTRKCPIVRLGQIQTSNPSEMVLIASFKCSPSTERKLHRKLKQYHVRGEWFEPSQAVMAEVEAAKIYGQSEPV